MKIIFLDIDGVLCTKRSHFVYGKEGKMWFDWDPLGCDAIAKACRNGARIVISSSWRQEKNRDELFAQLRKFGLYELLFQPDWFTPITGDTRGSEIQHWLDRHRDIGMYIIVDDNPDMLENQMRHFIRTDPDDGMTSENIKRLLNWSGVLKS